MSGVPSRDLPQNLHMISTRPMRRKELERGKKNEKWFMFSRELVGNIAAEILIVFPPKDFVPDSVTTFLEGYPPTVKQEPLTILVNTLGLKSFIEGLFPTPQMIVLLMIRCFW